MKSLRARFAKDESGATAIEYGLLAGLISVVILPMLLAIGPSLTAVFSAINNALMAVP